jgi:topoisomerase-4 subunit A
MLKPRPRLRNRNMEINFADVAIKGRDAQGNILTRYAIHKITLKEKGGSTLGGKQIWWDTDVQRLNEDGRGTLLGEFQAKDRLLIVTGDGNYRTSGFDISLHFEDNIRLIEKYDATTIFTAVYYDSESKFWYLKRFPFEQSAQLTSFVGEGVQQLKCLSREIRPRFKIFFGGQSKHKPAEIVVADEFITVKSFRARGKRLSTFELARVEEIAPLPPAEPTPQPENDKPAETPITPTVDRYPDISFEIEKVEQGKLGL